MKTSPWIILGATIILLVVVAHSNPSKIGKPFRSDRKLIHLGPDLKEDWEVVDLDDGERSFEVHRHFRPLATENIGGNRRMAEMMRRHGMGPALPGDWFAPQKRAQLLIVAGLDVNPFEAAINEDIRIRVAGLFPSDRSEFPAHRSCPSNGPLGPVAQSGCGQSERCGGTGSCR